ncbi:VWA domain-containing protein [Dysgonomonas sp. Marseille-P4677]|uniref:vWA domain-containing protein n=1 Tax=Dysgonomonas sp. Marseille-P4677 TaxID=2364790 RepID=UPI001914B1B2|nr:VWA domain-containing protein [Dysgonomonas sp. Marseille-P4677]MBK5721596.1 VWA domain-containing protein [Dysgonomonas sp. Marseille-P4677]
MFRFANPEFLYLFFTIPVFIIGFIYLNIRKRKSVEKLGTLALVKRMMPELSLKRSYLKFWLILVVIGFGIVVLARPQFGTKVEKIDKKGIELVIAIDVSNSMLAEDIKPSRLAKAKQILTRIIDERKDDKVAIVVFAGEAFIQLPLTPDNQSAKLFLETIDPSLVPVQGTAIGSAIDISMSCFSNDADIDRAIVLITDGEGHEGNAEEAAARAAEKGVHVNVVGIGTAEGAMIPVAEGATNMKRDTQGQPVVTKLNEEMCRQIAKAGKGLYAHADNSNSALKSLQAELEKLQKKEIDGIAYSEYDEKYQIFAGVMLILLLLEICIFEKKNRIFRNVRLFK